MKKNRLLNRTLSFGLALALFISSPASLYAEEMNDASVETIVENISEEADASDGGESSGSESTNASEGTNSESGSESTGSDQQTSDTSTSENDSNSEEQVNKGETPESSDETTTDEAETDADEKVDAEADADADKDAEDDDEEITYDYESNNDGTHVKQWTDKDGVAHEETEDCEFGEDGKCVHCGYEKEEEEDDEKITLQDEDGLVTITAKKSVLNGAKNVKVEEITVETDEEQYNEMSDALDKTTDSETFIIDFVAYDIKLFNEDGDEVEPKGEVNVVFNKLSVEGLDNEDYETEVFHYEDNENVNKMEDIEADENSVEMTTTHFSTYIVATTNSGERCYESKYLTISSSYRRGNQWRNFSNWEKFDESKYNEYYDYYGYSGVVYNGKTFDKNFYIVDIQIYVNDVLQTDEQNSVFVDAKQSGNKYYSNQKFKIVVSDGYSISSVRMVTNNDYVDPIEGVDGEYETTLVTSYNNGTQHNKLKVFLKSDNTNDVTSNAAFKVDIFKYNDNQQGNNTSDYPDWPINEVAKTNANGKNVIYMRNGVYSDGYACNKFYQISSDYGKTYQGMPDQYLSNSDKYGMIDFSKYGTPGFFITDAYQSSKKEYYDDTDYLSDGTWYKKGYYNVGFPIQLGEDGYYEYDSNKNSAVYNSSTHEIELDGTYASGANKGFWIFSDKSQYSNNEIESTYTNYHYGMHFTTEFNMTSDGKNNGEDCVFEFSGDDDVWVYIDGKIVLDLGGIHGVVGGKINFATGDCEVDSVANSSTLRYGTITRVWSSDDNHWVYKNTFNLYTDGIFSADEIKDNKSHVLQMYYLERGASQSNCKIRFNLPVINEDDEPVDPLTFRKVDGTDYTGLPNAKFTLVSEDGNLIALDADKNEYAISNKDGVVDFKYTKNLETGEIKEGVKQGVYLLTEIEAPEGYSKPSKSLVVNVMSDNQGGSNYTITSEDESIKAIKDTTYKYLVTNTLQTCSLTFEKQVVDDSLKTDSTKYLYYFKIERIKDEKGNNIISQTIEPVIENNKQTNVSSPGYTDVAFDDYLDAYGVYESMPVTLTGLQPGTYRISEVYVYSYLINDEVSLDTFDTYVKLNDADTNVTDKAFELSVTTNSVPKVTFVNSLRPEHTWQLKKVSKSNNDKVLEGAEFKLYSSDSTYYGLSNKLGYVEWFSSSEFSDESKVDVIPDGGYTLEETKAPTVDNIQYVRSNEKWTVEIEKYNKITVKNGDTILYETTSDNPAIEVLFENEVAYTLPETGGSGVYVYTIGGILLMIAGALLLYKNKNNKSK